MGIVKIMGNASELQRIMSNFIVTAAKEYNMSATCNFGELQINLEELQRMGNIQAVLVPWRSLSAVFQNVSQQPPAEYTSIWSLFRIRFR